MQYTNNYSKIRSHKLSQRRSAAYIWDYILIIWTYHREEQTVLSIHIAASY